METEPTISRQKQTRAAYTMPEFAAFFGREQTWAYRMKYQGKIKVLPSAALLGGGDMIPHSELERLLSKKTNYSDEIAGVPVPRKTDRSRCKIKRARMTVARKRKQKVMREAVRK